MSTSNLDARLDNSIGLGSLSPVLRSSRPSSTRSVSSRRSKPRTDGGTHAPTRLRLPTEPLAHFPRPRRQPNHRQATDEWQDRFRTWIEVCSGPRDEMVVDSRREHESPLSLLEYLLSISRPTHDEQLPSLQNFVRDSENSWVANLENASQQTKAWVDHQLWLEGEASSMTIAQQPNRILTNANLESELRPITNPVLSFHGHVKSIYRRLVYIADGDPSSVMSLIRQATISHSWALGELLRGHFNLQPDFSLRVEVIQSANVAAFVFHMPYLSLVRERKLDSRMITGHRLRGTYDLSCLRALGNRGTASISDGPFITEAVMSVAVTIRDDRWWEVTCLNDEFPLAESRLEIDPGNEREVPGVTVETPAGNSTAGQRPEPSRRRSYPGLEPNLLEQGDPVLDAPNSYSQWDPRVYALRVVQNYLEHIAQCEEALFEAIKKECRAYKNSRLENADRDQRFSPISSTPEQIGKAMDVTFNVMVKLHDTVKQQYENSQSFLTKYLGIDRTAPAGSWKFRDSLFVGLNDKTDFRAMDNCEWIEHSSARLHILLHAVESEMKSLEQLKDQHRKSIMEQHKASKKNSHAWSVRIGILLYFSQALMIPLTLYDIPNETTKLPNDSKGLAGVTMGLTAAFLVAPLLLWCLCLLAPVLRAYLTRRWFKWKEEPLLPMSKSRTD